MHAGSPGQPRTLAQRCALRFGLTPTSPADLRAVAADWIEDEGGHPLAAAALRAGLTTQEEEAPRGYGDGRGWGGGVTSGCGWGDVGGDGTLTGCGNGYGNGYGGGDLDRVGDGHGDGRGNWENP